MKSPVLIIFIILNLLAVNLVSAMTMTAGDTVESHHAHEQSDSHIQVTSAPEIASCIDESSCHHFCHISAHMVGYISQTTQLQPIDTVVALPVLTESFHSLILAPPFQPPKT